VVLGVAHSIENLHHPTPRTKVVSALACVLLLAVPVAAKLAQPAIPGERHRALPQPIGERPVAGLPALAAVGGEAAEAAAAQVRVGARSASATSGAAPSGTSIVANRFIGAR
jgi:hypothetical protein